MIYVVNKHTHTPTKNDVYIGRGSPLGNPFTHLKSKTKAPIICNSREEAILKCEEYLLYRIENKDKKICKALNDIYYKALKGDVYLVCFCSPNPLCHGNIIKKIVEDKIKIVE